MFCLCFDVFSNLLVSRRRPSAICWKSKWKLRGECGIHDDGRFAEMGSYTMMRNRWQEDISPCHD